MNKLFLSATVLLITLLPACGQKQGPEPPGSTDAPAPASPQPASAPFAQSQPAGPVEEGNVLPLKLTGLASVEDMNKGLAKLPDSESRQLFEEAYRLTFTVQASGRNYAQAEAKFRQVLQKHKKSVESYRGLGYALFNQGQMEEALQSYQRAIDIEDTYGEAHYALAFLYAMADPARGKKHYEKAMKLGVPDERKLGERFYSK